MSHTKIAAMALLVLGGILLFFGINAADAPAERISEAVSGRYSDETMMYFIAGGVSAVVGLALLFKK